MAPGAADKLVRPTLVSAARVKNFTGSVLPEPHSTRVGRPASRTPLAGLSMLVLFHQDAKRRRQTGASPVLRIRLATGTIRRLAFAQTPSQSRSVPEAGPQTGPCCRTCTSGRRR